VLASGPELAGETPAFLAEIGRERRVAVETLVGVADALLLGPRVVHREHVDVEGHVFALLGRKARPVSDKAPSELSVGGVVEAVSALPSAVLADEPLGASD
jgi:ABC-type proline/glycine betaine transport system ATPase subunit